MLASDYGDWDADYSERLRSLTPLSTTSKASPHGRFRRKSGSLHSETDEWIPPGFIHPDGLQLEFSLGSGTARNSPSRNSSRPSSAHPQRPSSAVPQRGSSSNGKKGFGSGSENRPMSRSSSISQAMSLAAKRVESYREKNQWPKRSTSGLEDSRSVNERSPFAAQGIGAQSSTTPIALPYENDRNLRGGEGEEGEHDDEDEEEDEGGDRVEAFEQEMDHEERTSRLLEISQLKVNLEDAQEALQSAIRDLQEGRPRAMASNPLIQDQAQLGRTSLNGQPSKDRDDERGDKTAPMAATAIDIDALASSIHDKLKESLKESMTEVIVERIAAHIEDLHENMTEQMDEMEKTIIQCILKVAEGTEVEHEAENGANRPPAADDAIAQEEGFAGNKGLEEGAEGNVDQAIDQGGDEGMSGEGTAAPDQAERTEGKDEVPATPQDLSKKSLSKSLSARLEALEERSSKRNKSSRSRSLSKSLSRLGLIKFGDEDEAQGEEEGEGEGKEEDNVRVKDQQRKEDEELMKAESRPIKEASMNIVASSQLQDAARGAIIEEKQLEIDALKLEVAAVKEAFDTLADKFGKQAKDMETIQGSLQALVEGMKGIQEQQKEVVDAVGKGGGDAV